MSCPAPRRRPPVRLIGIGNLYRGDDRVGIVVARRLRAAKVPGTQVMEVCGEASSLMEAWRDADEVIVVDAVQSGARPGTIHRVAAHAQRLPSLFFHCSIHTFGLAEAIELSRTLRQLPRRLIVYGIEGKSFAAGTNLSREVAEAAEKVVQRVRRQLAARK